MKNDSYDRKEPAELYDDIWNYSDEAISRIAQIISNEIIENNSEPELINILDIGIGTGSLTLRVGNELIDKHNRNVRIHGIDISECMIDRAKEKLSMLCELNDNVTIFQHDARMVLPLEFRDKTYDVIIITFVLHYLDESSDHFMSWKDVLKTTNSLLKESGILIQAEVIGDMGAVDGLFPDISDDQQASVKFVEFWKHYFQERNKLYSWSPELRPSSYLPVYSWLACDQNKQKFSLLPLFGFVTTEKKEFNWSDILDWIRFGVFTSLSVGLTGEQRESLSKKQQFYLQQKHIEVDELVALNRSVRFQVHQRISHPVYASRTPFYASSISLQEYQSKFGFKALSLQDSCIPIKDNKLLALDEDRHALLSFLDECIIPVLGGAFLDCELTLLDFLQSHGGASQWASIARIRPEFQQNRSNFVHKINEAKASMIDLLIHTPGEAGRIFLIYSEEKYADSIKNISKSSIKDGHIGNLSKHDQDLVQLHRYLASPQYNQAENKAYDFKKIFTYYIAPLFIPTPREASSEKPLGIGGLILVSKQKIAVDILECLQSAISQVANPIGAAYLRTEQVRQTKKAVRAAIFARNFSHIIGSHIISNPEFRHSLIGAHHLSQYRNTLTRIYNDFVKAENSYLTHDYNESSDQDDEIWEQATKVLAEIKDRTITGDLLMENTRRFHDYLQGRFDFIARAIDDVKDQSEPVWFVKDLMDGFLMQTAYLDNLVADEGLTRANMQFILRFIEEQPNQSESEFLATWESIVNTQDDAADLKNASVPLAVKWEPRAPLSQIRSIDDHPILISLPGGMVSAHAFYSLLENIIRNSAKYGCFKKKRQENMTPYCITIEIKHVKSGEVQHFALRIWDNYSGAEIPLSYNEDAKTWSNLQKTLEQSFVKPTGESETQNLGMMEMQACAQLLSGGIKTWTNETLPDHIFLDLKKYSQKYRLMRANSLNLWTANPDQSGVIEEDHMKALTFQLNLNSPVLLGCLTNHKKQFNAINGSLMIRTNKLSRIEESLPQILVIDGNQPDIFMEALSQIETTPQVYPYRTFVLCPNKEIITQWETILRSLKGLPVNRVPILADNRLYNFVFSNFNDENSAILAAYEAWLRAWKGEPDSGTWHLWIGLERSASQVKEAWENQFIRFNSLVSPARDVKDSLGSQFQNSLISLRLCAFSKDEKINLSELESGTEKIFAYKQEDWESIRNHPYFSRWLNDRGEKSFSNEEKYWLVERARPFEKKCALVFDNHANCFSSAVEKERNIHYSTRFYQQLSGTVSPELFRVLVRPPKDVFGFHFFIYSLVEACLTNIVVVDERLVSNLIDGCNYNEVNPNFVQLLSDHQKAGTYPVFRSCVVGAPEKAGYYNSRHPRLLAESQKVSSTKPFIHELNWDRSKPSANLNLMIPTNSQSVFAISSSKIVVDVLLIHEGAMDILALEDEAQWIIRSGSTATKSLFESIKYDPPLNALYQLTPSIIRTSGRGRKSKYLGEFLPFIEFGQVSSALLTARNKFSLVRGLLGSFGTKPYA